MKKRGSGQSPSTAILIRVVALIFCRPGCPKVFLWFKTRTQLSVLKIYVGGRL